MAILPRELHALTAAYCNYIPDGNFFRREAGDCAVKSITYDDYLQSTRKNGLIHSFRDAPAVVWVHGEKQWWTDGMLHRDGAPAVVSPSGLQIWYRNGKYHRDGDAPAVIHLDGTQEWWRDGLRHRDGAPAVIMADGTQTWWRDGVKTQSSQKMIAQ